MYDFFTGIILVVCAAAFAIMIGAISYSAGMNSAAHSCDVFGKFEYGDVVYTCPKVGT